MRKALVILAMLAVVGPANAEYRIFFTAASDNTMGLTNGFNPDGTPFLIDSPSTSITSNDNVPIYDDNTDVYGGDYVLAGGPSYMTGGHHLQDCDNPEVGDEWFYIWGQFHGEDTGVRLFSASLNVVRCDEGSLADNLEVVWYKVDNMASPMGVKRWDGYSTEADDYANFRTISKTLVAVTAYGIKNQGGSGGNWNLYTGGAQNGDEGRVSLIGAIRIPPGEDAGPYTISIPTDLNGDPLFAIGGVASWPVVGAFTTPEPASLLLLGLAGLLIRRR
ncbi:MAG: PEP-CTERM sorting domain-containing protein [Phycisphaerae bacterium]|nr:PEP-CTERM sorting domain-containing protein [Phycisphaerae bacterium]